MHARWNSSIITALVSGCRKALLASGVKDDNIIVESVPGSYELPAAVQRVYAASQIQSTTSTLASGAGNLIQATTDLLGSTSSLDKTGGEQVEDIGSGGKAAFDAVIAIGVLIKGETMHFEYIADATSHGLMRVQLDTGVPVIFGLLTVLSQEQALARAGLEGGTGVQAKGHNHGEDWGNAAVEMGVKRRAWGEGRFVG